MSHNELVRLTRVTGELSFIEEFLVLAGEAVAEVVSQENYWFDYLIILMHFQHFLPLVVLKEDETV